MISTSINVRYDFKDASEGIDKTVGGTEYTPKDLEMPEDFPELERPALRKIDKYCTPECPCCNLSKRYTQVHNVPVATCLRVTLSYRMSLLKPV